MRTFKVYFRRNGKIDNCWVTAGNAAEAAQVRTGITVVKVVPKGFCKAPTKSSYTYTYLTR